MILRDLGEFGLIEEIRKKIHHSRAVLKGIGDDAAVIRYGRSRYLLYTADMILEGRHFLRAHGGYLIGRKAMAVNVSDIAAMGGRPRWALVSIGVPASLERGFVEKLYKGIKYISNRYGIDIVGGDTIGSRKIIVGIALLGEVERKYVVFRDGAHEGDIIGLTGEIGGSIKGRHLRFIPRVAEARFLVERFKINSMIDVSDGLLIDLGHIVSASKKGAVIFKEAVPLSRDADTFRSAVSDGEDFELLFTFPPREKTRLAKEWPFRTKLSFIGRIEKQRSLYIMYKGVRKEINAEGFTHF